MKAFIQSIPRSSGSSSSSSSRSSSSSSSNRGGGAGGAGKRPLATTNKENASRGTGAAKAPRQMYLDLGQKSFGKSKECMTCGMLYVVGDEDDEQRHRQNCTKIRDGPVLPSMKGLKTVVEAEDARGNKGVILEVRQVAGKGFPDNVAHVLGHVHKELGASDDEVRSSSSGGAGAVCVSSFFSIAYAPPVASRNTLAAKWRTCTCCRSRGPSWAASSRSKHTRETPSPSRRT